jgi:hypothetical protein
LVSSKHYQAAEKAHTANNDAEAHKELDAASKALSQGPRLDVTAVPLAV